MKQRMRRGYGIAIGMLLSGAVLAAGCGSSSGSLPSGDGPNTRIVGKALVPAAQVATAAPTRGTRILARAFSVGSPAEAGAAIARRPIGAGSVALAAMSSQVTISRTTTADDGSFVLEGATPGTTFLITVTAPGAGGRPLTLRRVIRTGPLGQTRADVDETTTVGAAAGAQVAAEGGDDDDVAETADEVADAQESAEGANAGATPDLSDPGQAQALARVHLVGSLDTKIQAVLAGQPNVHQAKRALMAAQVYARVMLGLPAPTRLGRAQVVALADRITQGQQKTAAQVASHLAAAGARSGESAVTEADVRAALGALKARDHLVAPLGGVGVAAIPTTVALLLCEQVTSKRAGEVPFAIGTQAQLDAFVTEVMK